VLDRERILARLDQLDSYLGELRQVLPDDFALYRRVERKRACERLLQLSVEAALDICHLLVTGLRLGIPAEEVDLLDKLEKAHVLSPRVVGILKEMRGFRNILVHEYTRIDDRIVYQIAKTRLSDFDVLKHEVVNFLKSYG
jgi:uncharacterized protein YutE (UPF0331/DUF86 family)